RLEHHIGLGSYDPARTYDLKLSFDILLHRMEAATRIASSSSVVRLGGPEPLRRIAVGDANRLKEAFRDVDAVIALSPQLTAEAHEFHPRVYFSPIRIDLDVWHRDARTPRPAGMAFTVGMAASLRDDAQKETKGYDIARRASEIAGVELFVVGQGMTRVAHD